MPPKLSYKSRAEREEEEREERERLERERLEREREEARQVERRPEGPAAPTPARRAPPKPLPTTPDEALFAEDAMSLTPKEVAAIQIQGAPEAAEEEGEVEPEEEEEARPERRPPRPPRSPDPRPVAAGFILVFTGLTQVLWGIWSMTRTGEVGTGPWAPFFRWGHFSFSFTAVLLGLLAIRGGLWSFRKERFDVVKVGAIAATGCVWALWIPWVFGLLALLIIHKAREEYYPFYDPRWDAPEWARPPPGHEEEGNDEEREGAGEGNGGVVPGGEGGPPEGDALSA
jgi:hypothetical protein